MSEKSVAVVSICAAVICGAFFYPPEPEQKKKPVATTPALQEPKPVIVVQPQHPALHGADDKAQLALRPPPRVSR